MRIIDADKLKSYIDAQKGRPFIGCTIGEALKIITDEQPTVDAFQAKLWEWIPCSKEMPQKKGRYIVTVRNIFDNIEVRFRYWNADCNLWSGDQMDEVLAWCEIPEPWEGDANGED